MNLFVLNIKKLLLHFFFMEKKQIIKSLIREIQHKPLPKYTVREITIPLNVEKIANTNEHLFILSYLFYFAHHETHEGLEEKKIKPSCPG